MLNLKNEKMKMLLKNTIIMVFFTGMSFFAFAQNNMPKIEYSEITKAVDSLALKMMNLYVFPSKGKEVHDLLTQVSHEISILR